MTLDVCGALDAGLGQLFSCTQTSRGHVRVRTPFLYPDGGVVDIFVVEHDGGKCTVTDFGEALGWLRMQTVSGRRSPKQNKLVQDVGVTLGVEVFKGQLSVRTAPEDITEAVIKVAQAAVRVTDLWFTTRTRSVESVTDEVEDFLGEVRIDFERGVRLPGRSGRSWTIDFQTRTPERTALVSVLSTGSRASARRVSEHVVATWHDLSYMRVGGPKLSFVSLFDDTSDVWSEEDFKLVGDLSEVKRWSRPDEFAEYLRAA